MSHDIIISGAGPSGLCLARALSGHGLNIALVEPQSRESLSNPAFDGREIALTQVSAQTMRKHGLWAWIEKHEPLALAPMKHAKVLDGPSTFEMLFSHTQSRHSELGWLLSNHHIRRAAYEMMHESEAKHGDITLYDNTASAKVEADINNPTAPIKLHTKQGKVLVGKLLIAADSRFSPTRRDMGIEATMHDFGRSMLVCAMTHTVPHNYIAWEWFDYAQTLALLPMNDCPLTGLPRSSVVLTLAGHQMDAMMAMDEQAFSQDMTRRFANRLGTMTIISTRHVYPLVGVYPKHFVAHRFACVGDAAVGMHPVTAHGFNFSLLSTERLSKLILEAYQKKRDIASPALLRQYERGHRKDTLPLYLTTRAIIKIYTDERLPFKFLRQAALRVGQRVMPFKRAVVASLVGSR